MWPLLIGLLLLVGLVLVLFFFGAENNRLPILPRKEKRPPQESPSPYRIDSPVIREC